TGDDLTVGGWARIATLVRRVRAERRNPILVLDAGDFLMGSLFHLRAREEAFELRLLDKIGYDAVGLGNHEFDLKPAGLARILAAGAPPPGERPVLLLANAIFSPESDQDDGLETLFRQGVVKPFTVLDCEGLRVGLFGLMGREAAEVAPFATPVSFADPVATAREVVRTLREEERADLIVCLSHGGLWAKTSKSEDEILARKVAGLDVIVSGHTHTALDRPITVGGTLVVQAGENGKRVGVLDILHEEGRTRLARYEAVAVDDSLPSDPEVTGMVEGFIASVNRHVLAEHRLEFSQAVAETDFDVTAAEAECGLGNMVTDAMRWAVDGCDADPAARVALAVESLGLIRDPVVRGVTGRVAVCDLFDAFPLGIGLDDTPGYPLVSVYLTGAEVKKSLEVLTSIYPLKGADYFLQVSGLKFTYNPRRMIFDRVTDIRLEDAAGEFRPLDYSGRNPTLYRVVANYYNATFLSLIGSLTRNILKIVPKDRHGRPVEDLAAALVDADQSRPGVQELKEWVALFGYVRSFADIDGDGLPEIPARYRGPEGRIVAAPSRNPISLLRRGNWLTWGACGLIVLFLFLVVFIPVKISRRLRRRR
ncbi:MAG: bifunctional metallophosphatase/5'-nucleotidase, partial [Candidatus Aminicenantes bacterium]|nr:bifunctional metallophosphatase/5'-nucleotidase [Candidatus Aminicenantes bacterium]